MMKPIATMMVLFKAVNGMDKEVRSVQGTMNKVQAAVSKAGQAMTAAFSVPLGLAGAGILRTGIDQSKAFNKMTANINGSRSELAALGKEMAQFAGDSPLAVAEVFDIGTELGRAGQNLKQVAATYKTIGQLAVAHDASTTETAKTVSQIQNLYGGSAGSISDLISGAVTSAPQDFQDFSYFIEHAASPIRAMGGTLDDLRDINVALATFGIRASRGGAQAKSVMDNMFDTKTSQSLGIRSAYGEDGKTLLRPMEYLQEMAKAFDKMDEVTRRSKALDIFGKIGVTGMAPIIDALRGGEMQSKLFESLNKAMNNTGLTKTMHDKMMEGLSGAFENLKSSWDSLTRSLTTSSVGGIIILVINALANVLDTMAKLPPAVLTIGLLMFTALAGIGPATILFMMALKMWKETSVEMALLYSSMKGNAAISALTMGGISMPNKARLGASNIYTSVAKHGKGGFITAFLTGIGPTIIKALKPMIGVLTKGTYVLAAFMIIIDTIAMTIRTAMRGFAEVDKFFGQFASEGESVGTTWMRWLKMLGFSFKIFAIVVGFVLGMIATAMYGLLKAVGAVVKGLISFAYWVNSLLPELFRFDTKGTDSLLNWADTMTSMDFSDTAKDPEKAASNVSTKMYGNSAGNNQWGEDKKIVIETNNPQAVKSFSRVFDLRQRYGVI